MQPFLLTSVQFITYPVQTSDSSLFNRFLTPYNPSTYSPSIAFLFHTNARLTPLLLLQSLSYSLITPIQSHFYPLTIPQLTPLQLHFYPLTNVRLTPLQSLSYSLTIVLDPYKCPTYPSSNVLLTPYNRPTYPPSNALLIPYKPWPYSRSIDCLSRNNVRLIPLQFHTKVQIYPH